MMYARNELRLRGRVGWAGPAVCVALVIVALALLTRDAMGQEVAQDFDLIGTVTDGQTGQPLVGAFVSMTGSEWGSVTGDDGRFVIPDVYAGRISLTTEQLGYETLVWEGEIGADDPLLALAMTPQPVLLEGLQVVTDRFRTRRNRTSVSVQSYDRDALAQTHQETILDFVAMRAGAPRARCGGNARGDICLRIRGQSIEPVVYVDEAPVLGGLDYLDVLQPHELYMIEVYGQGRHIRAYTTQFMERAAKTRLLPIALLF